MKKARVIVILIILIIIMLIFGTHTNIKNKNAVTSQKRENTKVEYQGYTLVAEKLISDKTDETSIKANTKYLQELIDKASNSGGGLVRIPAGTYYFASQGANTRKVEEYVIKCKNNVIVEGAGTDEQNANNCTILKPYGKTTIATEGGIDMFYYNDYKDSGCSNKEFLENADFRNFIIDGEDASGKKYNSSGKGFMINLFKDCDWENVKVRNTDGTGFGMDCPINCTIKNCEAINCGKAVKTKDDPGGSGFGIGTGFSDDEYIYIEGCSALGNGKYGIFFEQQSRFGTEINIYPSTKAKGFVASNCIASGNLYDFGAARGYDITYENCTANSSYINSNVTNSSHFKFESMSRRTHLVNCKVEKEFTDVEETIYYYEALCWAMNNAILNENQEDTFEPSKVVTRAQAVDMIWSMAERPGELIRGVNATIGEAPYDDVKTTHIYADAIKWAKENNITNEEKQFLPDSNCSRADFITFLWKYAGSPEVNIKNNFSDIQEGTEYEKAVNWAISIGITKGNGNGKFSPEEGLARKDIVTFLYRYVNSTSCYNITYNLNGGEVAKANPTTYQAGKSSFTLDTPTKEGYTFTGWSGSNITEDGYLGGSNLKPQKVVTITTDEKGNKVYTANWIANSYIISFNGNGGIGTLEEQYFKYDDVPQKLLKNEITRRGYNFKGWNTKQDGTGTEYIDEQVVRNLTKINNEVIILYAQWAHEEHIEVIDKAKEPTCTEEGLTEGAHCKICNYVIKKQEKIKALGHSFTNYESNNNATCTKDGTKTAKCDRCSETKTIVDEGSKKGHTKVIDKAKEPTCTEEGLTEGAHCEICNYVIKKQEKIKALGHSYKNGICIRCNKEEDKLKVESDIYKIKDVQIYRIKANTTIKIFKSNLNTNATDIKVYDDKEKEQEDSKILSTGMKIEFKYQNEKKTFGVSVLGDTNGDGKVNVFDMLAINRHRLKRITLRGVYFLSGDVNEDEKVDLKDLVKINRVRLHKNIEL